MVTYAHIFYDLGPSTDTLEQFFLNEFNILLFYHFNISKYGWGKILKVQILQGS